MWGQGNLAKERSPRTAGRASQSRQKCTKRLLKHTHTLTHTLSPRPKKIEKGQCPMVSCKVWNIFGGGGWSVGEMYKQIEQTLSVPRKRGSKNRIGKRNPSNNKDSQTQIATDKQIDKQTLTQKLKCRSKRTFRNPFP